MTPGRIFEYDDRVFKVTEVHQTSGGWLVEGKCLTPKDQDNGHLEWNFRLKSGQLLHVVTVH